MAVRNQQHPDRSIDFGPWGFGTADGELPLPAGLDAPDFGARDVPFAVDPFTGSASAVVPLRTPEGRDGFGPQLELRYDSRSGHGVFGQGWSLNVPSVERASRVSVPRYNDGDTFELGGAELVPALVANSQWTDDVSDVGEYSVRRYRRRFETSAARIEHWTHKSNGQTHWRTVDGDNVTRLFGVTSATRVFDPRDPQHVVRWLLAECFDDRGNVIRYTYKGENGHGAAKYLKRVLYGNTTPHERGPWHFEVVLDYGEHDLDHPESPESGTWSLRPDPVSDRRAGFEQTLWRRCRRILVFHRFDELGPNPYLVSSTDLDYEGRSARSVLSAVTQTGYVWGEQDEPPQTRSLPTKRFSYTDAGTPAENVIQSQALTDALTTGERPMWLDYHSEGLSGLLYQREGEWQYVRNLGGARFAETEAVPFEQQIASELPTDNSTRHDADFQPTSVNGRLAEDPDSEPVYIDLNGDGQDDMIVATASTFRWYPSSGDEGYADPVVLYLQTGDHRRAHRLGVREQCAFYLADMTGDGTHDLVRVGGEQVIYWPGFGDGKFDEPVEMQSAPSIPEESLPAVHLADLTGTGQADLVCPADGTLRFWPNRAGLVFGDQESISAQGLGSTSAVDTLDLLGRRSDAVVWVDTTGKKPTVRYASSVAGHPSGLLSEVDTGAGHVTRLAWLSSIDAWRRDRDSGREWLFPSLLPVFAVERTEVRDSVAGNRLFHRYLFRHISYESAKANLTGFASSEVWQGGRVEDYALPGLFPERSVPDVPEHRRSANTLTKRWFHTGDTVDGEDMAEELVSEFHTDSVSGRHRWLTKNLLPVDATAKEAEASLHGLRGLLLREEVFPGGRMFPLRVREQNGCLHRVQPPREDRMASLRSHAVETVDVVYEDVEDDPRINHRLVLDVDACGNLVQQVEVAYARVQPEVDGQGETRAVLTEYEVGNFADQDTWHRVGVPLATVQWELTQLPQRGPGLFELNSLKDVASNGDAVLLSKKRHRYWANDATSVLPVGGVESRALPARTEQLAFGAHVAQPALDDDADALLRHEGGYEEDEDGWWAPGDTLSYDVANFFRVVGRINALGHETKYRYDATFLHRTGSEDGYGNANVCLVHPRSQKWWKCVDPAGVTTQRRFDALGNVLSLAISGDNGDSLAPDSIEAVGSDDPTAVITYSLDGDHGWAWLRQRQEHGVRPMVLSEIVLHVDGSGTVLRRAERHDGSWRLSTMVEVNAHGLPVRRAEPFHHENPTPSAETCESHLGAGKQFHYDQLNRVTKVNESNGIIGSFEYRPWSVATSDGNDNVLDSDWYAERQGPNVKASDFGSRRSARRLFEARAAAQSAATAQTPQVDYLGALGHVVARSAGGTEIGLERLHLDALGRVTAVVDAGGRELNQRQFDLMGRQLTHRTIDSGERTEVRAASGELLRSRGADGFVKRYRYDAVGRVTHVYVTAPDEENETLAERFVWGGGETFLENEAALGLAGRLHMHLGAAGLEVVEQYDASGRALRVTRRPPSTGADQRLDWSVVTELRHGGEMLSILSDPDSPRIQADALEATYAYDTLGRIRSYSGPDGVDCRQDHETQLAPSRVQAVVGGREAEVVNQVDFTAEGRLVGFRARDGLRLVRTYDPCGRLTESAVSQGEGEPSVQDAQFVYDAMGNVTSVSSGGELVASYAYDVAYRLTKAEGLEPRGPEGGVRRFANSYDLDSAGNLQNITHSATGVEWQRRYYYEAGTNRLLGAMQPDEKADDVPVSFTYDTSGNVTSGASGETYEWDHDNRLVRVTRKGDTVVYGYDRNGEVARRVTFRSDGTVDETVAMGRSERTRRYVEGEVQDEDWETTVRFANTPAVSIRREGSNTPQITYYVTDHLRSIVVEAAADTSVLTEQEFLPFGIPWIRQSRPYEVNYMRFGFRGGRYDLDTRLLWLDGRWYSPWMGRFLAPLTNGNDNGTNGYLMAGGNPQRVPRRDSRLRNR